MITSKFEFGTYLWSPDRKLVKKIKRLERMERFWKYSILTKTVRRKKGYGDEFWFSKERDNAKNELLKQLSYNVSELSNFQTYINGALNEIKLFNEETKHYFEEQDKQHNALVNKMTELKDSYPTLFEHFMNNKDAKFRFDRMIEETLNKETMLLLKLITEQRINAINSITKRVKYFSEIDNMLRNILELNAKHIKNLNEQSLSKLVKRLGEDYPKQVKLGKSVSNLIKKIYKLSDSEKKESEKLNREYKNIIQHLRRIKDDVYTMVSIIYLGPDYPERLKKLGDKVFINELKNLPGLKGGKNNPKTSIGAFLSKNFNFIHPLENFGRLRSTATHSTASLYIYPKLPRGPDYSLINVGIIIQAFDIHDNQIDGIGDDLNNSLNTIIIQYINSLLQLGELTKSFPPHKTASEKLLDLKNEMKD